MAKNFLELLTSGEPLIKTEVSFDLLSTAKAAGILLLLFILVIFFIRITAPSRALPQSKP